MSLSLQAHPRTVSRHTCTGLERGAEGGYAQIHLQSDAAGRRGAYVHADPHRGGREVARYAPLRVLHSPVLAHVEVLDLARYSSRHLPLLCVEARDVIDAALALNQVIEEGVGVVTERGEGSEASDDDLRAPIRLRVRPPVAARGSVRGTAQPGMAPFAASTGPPASRGPQHDLR